MTAYRIKSVIKIYYPKGSDPISPFATRLCSRLKTDEGAIMMNECFAECCANQAVTEFCPECLRNGGIKPQNFISAELEKRFSYHSPKEGQPEKYKALREKAKELAHMIDELCPDSREKSVAMTNLETTVMWANASIARN